MDIFFQSRLSTCITSTKFSIKVNGDGHGYFEGERNLRLLGSTPDLLRNQRKKKMKYREVRGSLSKSGKKGFLTW